MYEIQMFKTSFTRRLQSVWNFRHLGFEFVLNFGIRISDLRYLIGLR
jgi:hypothetical protein